jgi:hypothetical protein
VERFESLPEAQAALGSACLAVQEAQAMGDVLRAFGMSREDVEALGERIREEVVAHARVPERTRS